MATTILIVEDEPAVAEQLSSALRESDWQPVAVDCTASAWLHLQQHFPQLVLLNWELLDHSGLQLLMRIRKDRLLHEIPVIMLTARHMEDDKVTALNCGADDYVTKPFSLRELSARVRAVLRRRCDKRERMELAIGPVTLDLHTSLVSLHGKAISIGYSEYRLLKFLMSHPGRAFSRRQLLDKVWESQLQIDERTVDAHILRLRKALKEGCFLIKTVRGVGYLLSESEVQPSNAF